MKSTGIFIFLFLTGILGSRQASALDIPTNAEKKIVHITETGFAPETLTLAKSDSTVFFYNASKENIDTFAIAFGKNRLHCHNPSLILEDGVLTSTQPIIPGSFVIACFPDIAEYPVRATVGGKVLTGTIAVAPPPTQEAN